MPKLLLIFEIFMLFMTSVSCNKQKIGPQFETGSSLSGYQIRILNEGNFGFGNSSVTSYNPFTKELLNNTFISQNGNQIGDVLQSGTYHNGLCYLIVNNSSKIVIVDSSDFSFKGEITGFNSPRYISFYENKAYVTDLKEKAIYVVDYSAKSIINRINTIGWNEQMIIHNDYMYVCDRGDYLNNTGNNKCYKISLLSNTIIDSVIVPLDPNSIVVDHNNMLWVLSSGGINLETPKLSQINPNNMSIIKTISFNTINESPFGLVIDSENDHLYFINKSIYRMNINDNSLPVTSFVNGDNHSFYGLSINKLNNEIYVSDAKDYIQNGTVYRYFENGELIDEIQSGIIPQYFMF